MIIWINNPKPFEAAVIVRFIYYSTGFENIDLYITNLEKMEPFIHASKIPKEEIEKIKFEKPNGKFLIIDRNGKSINEVDIKNYDGFVIDFSGEIEGEKVKILGLSDLSFESIAVLSKIFLKKENFNLNIDIYDELYYLIREIVETSRDLDIYRFIHPRFLFYVLSSIENKFGINIKINKTIIKIKDKKVLEKVYLEYYDNNMNIIDRDFIILRNNKLEIPVIYNGKKEKYRFLINFDKKVVLRDINK